MNRVPPAPRLPSQTALHAGLPAALHALLAAHPLLRLLLAPLIACVSGHAAPPRRRAAAPVAAPDLPGPACAMPGAPLRLTCDACFPAPHRRARPASPARARRPALPRPVAPALSPPRTASRGPPRSCLGGSPTPARARRRLPK